ncbi:TetR/AcrR family transcriptional regulator [Massilia endophytica]|uniref:TetR/AcrR family transcriptional regulator n=1 Tax=Massilia endophytica TaxID=2899220 RepID=UPI001E2CB9CA|nr:TetR/AcrR family transcriptional regulator [Massilia endophytica]UGQ46235.1 TetR/AcrR family transcriptional regulator [Massilia endophytica]
MKTSIADSRQHILRIGKGLILRKGFTAVGLAELLAAASVPKGSFYHYFASKEAFGEALLEWYFEEHLQHLDTLLTRPSSAAERLNGYWRYWLAAQRGDDPNAKCLAVKLSAEVSDLSEAMRAVLERGTDGVIRRLTECIEDGKLDGSIAVPDSAKELATSLYAMWLGASLLAKVTQDDRPLQTAMVSTRHILKLSR